MVCTFGRGRMAAIVRLLTIESSPEKSSEEARQEKIATEAIRREFQDADEANLLEEKDMYVFDSMPLTDPLHLVCCNACMKPVKASQYSAHAERCRSFNTTGESSLELDGGTGHKKPPKKGRKKSQVTNNNQARDQEKSESMDVNGISGSESNFDGRNGTLCSPPVEAQRRSTSSDHATITYAYGVSPGGSNCTSDMPIPLATKIYLPQRSHRLRAALAHIYHEMPAKEHGGYSMSQDLEQDGTTLSSQAAYLSKSLHGSHKDDVPQTKNETHALDAINSPDQILAQSSEHCLGSSREFLSAFSSSNEFRENGSLRPGFSIIPASVGLMKNSYHPASYSYSRNSDTVSALGPMRKAGGSVPVV